MLLFAAGAIKRWHHHRGSMTHGSKSKRQHGSIGSSATPSRVLPGLRMAGQLGNKRRTIKGLEVCSSPKTVKVMQCFLSAALDIAKMHQVQCAYHGTISCQCCMLMEAFSLQVLMVDTERGALVVKGSVPGKPGCVVEVTPGKIVGKNC